MTSIKLSNKILASIQSLDKLLTDNHNLTITYSSKTDQLILQNNSFKAIYSTKDLEIKNKADISIDIDCIQLIETLSFFKIEPTLQFSTSLLEIIKGKKRAKIDCKLPTPFITYSEIPLCTFDIPDIDSILKKVNILVSSESTVTFKKDKMMIINSSSRDAIFLSTLNKSIPLVDASNKELIFSIPGKRLSHICKGIITACSKISAEKIKFNLLSVNTNIVLVSMYIEKDNNSIETYCPILDEVKSTNLLNKCSTFSPSLKIKMDLLLLSEACAASAVSCLSSGEDPKIILSNKKSNKKIEVKDQTDSFFDELDIEADCAFTVTVRNSILSNILQFMSMSGAYIALDKSNPILTIKNSNESFFVSCFNTGTMPFEIIEYKNEKDSLVSNKVANIPNPRGTIQQPTGSSTTA